MASFSDGEDDGRRHLLSVDSAPTAIHATPAAISVSKAARKLQAKARAAGGAPARRIAVSRGRMAQETDDDDMFLNISGSTMIGVQCALYDCSVGVETSACPCAEKPSAYPHGRDAGLYWVHVLRGAICVFQSCRFGWSQSLTPV